MAGNFTTLIASTPNISAVSSIIKKEKPDALLPTVGGQTELDTAIELHKNGILEQYNVELIGANLDAIQKAEHREIMYNCKTTQRLQLTRHIKMVHMYGTNVTNANIKLLDRIVS